MQKILQSDQGTTKLKIEEFRRGLNPNGSLIGTYRSNSYSNWKRQRNPLARGFVDLMNTKSYVKGLYVKKVNRLQYQFESTDSKDSMLAEKYGQQIRGLSKFSYKQRVNYYSVELGKALKAKL